MGADIVATPSKGLMNCCDHACSSLATGSSDGVWIRSIKRKYDELESSSHFYIPGFDILPVARVEIENECALLRETVRKQQETIHNLFLELDEERNASSTAANEAMSMILRLQREKAAAEMESRQFKRFAEEKILHDGQEIGGLEEVLYKREQTIQSLTCEVQAYKHRMMSFGVSESEAEGLKGKYSQSPSFSSDAEGQINYPSFSYPPLRCNFNESHGPLEVEDDTVDIDKYPFDETPRSQDLKSFEHKIHQLERTRGDHGDGDSGSRSILEKFIVGQPNSPRVPKLSTKVFADSSSLYEFGRDTVHDYTTDSPKWGTSCKRLDCVTEELTNSDYNSDFEDDMSDRVYTVDSVNLDQPYKDTSEPKVTSKFFDEYVSTPNGSNYMDPGSDVKKLNSRIQTLEADRESMRQAIISMQTDKAQLVLLREIAQQLCKDMTPTKSKPVEKPSIAKRSPLLVVFKWIMSFILWRRKACQSKYMLDLAASNVGLLMLLDRTPARIKQWRCITSTQVGKRI